MTPLFHQPETASAWNSFNHHQLDADGHMVLVLHEAVNWTSEGSHL